MKTYSVHKSAVQPPPFSHQCSSRSHHLFLSHHQPPNPGSSAPQAWITPEEPCKISHYLHDFPDPSGLVLRLRFKSITDSNHTLTLAASFHTVPLFQTNFFICVQFRVWAFQALHSYPLGEFHTSLGSPSVQLAPSKSPRAYPFPIPLVC